jgi:hypothetical protein
MARDPTIVERTKVGAEFMAEVINSFVEPISWKTLVCSTLTCDSNTHRTALVVHTFLCCIFHCVRQLNDVAVSIQAQSGALGTTSQFTTAGSAALLVAPTTDTGASPSKAEVGQRRAFKIIMTVPYMLFMSLAYLLILMHISTD